MDKETQKSMNKLRPLIFRIVMDTISEYQDMEEHVLEEEMYIYIVNNIDAIKTLFDDFGKDKEINIIMNYLIDYFTKIEEYEICSIIHEIKTEINTTE